MSLFEKAINAPFKMIDQSFEAMDRGFDTVFGPTQSRRRQRRQMAHSDYQCAKCRDTRMVAVPDASGAMVAVPCPYCEGW